MHIQSETLLKITKVNIPQADLDELVNLEVVKWKSEAWGISWDSLGILAGIWLGYPREKALVVIEQLLRPVTIPDYDSVMNHAE